MKSQAYVAISLVCFVCGCATTQTKLDSLTDGTHKTLATNLLQRNPEEDASAFYRLGGRGYIMSSGGGGLMFPIGVDGSHSARFESLEQFAPTLYSQISSLLIDPNGPVTMEEILGDVHVPQEREFYRNARGTYATKFNRQMEKLEKQSHSIKSEVQH